MDIPRHTSTQLSDVVLQMIDECSTSSSVVRVLKSKLYDMYGTKTDIIYPFNGNLMSVVNQVSGRVQVPLWIKLPCHIKDDLPVAPLGLDARIKNFVIDVFKQESDIFSKQNLVCPGRANPFCDRIFKYFRFFHENGEQIAVYVFL